MLKDRWALTLQGKQNNYPIRRAVKALKMCIPFDPAILGIRPMGLIKDTGQRFSYKMVHQSTIHWNRDVETTQTFSWKGLTE